MFKKFLHGIMESLFFEGLLVVFVFTLVVCGVRWIYTSSDRPERLVVRSCKDHFPVHDYGFVKYVFRRDGYVKFELVDGNEVKLSEGTCYSLDGEVSK